LNLLKSIFISAFVSWLSLVTIYAMIELASGNTPLLSWLGLALTAFAPLVFFIKAFIAKSARTPRHPVEYSILSGAGLALTMVMSYRYGDAAGMLHIWAFITLLAWLVYLRWYSAFKGRDAQPLTVGSALPDFQLETLDSQTVSSASFKTGAHLLVFYRGNWCPFCTAQIAELAAAYRRLEALGVTVVLISSQSIKKNQQLAAQFEVPMVFLRDRDNEAAKKLGIFQKWGTPLGMQMLGYGSDTVLPTVILTNAQGDIVSTDQTDNYRVRPAPEVFEALLAQSLKQ